MMRRASWYLLLALLTITLPALAQPHPDFIPPPLSSKDVPSSDPGRAARAAPAAPVPAADRRPASAPATLLGRPAHEHIGSAPAARNATPRPGRSSSRTGWTAAEGQAAVTTLAIDCIQSPWNAAFQSQRGRGPVVEVELPVDQTGEAIGTAALAQQARKLLRAAGMNSAPGQAPDHVLTGVLLSLHDGRLDRDDAVVQSYLLGLSLVEVESGAKVWMDLFHLRKLVTAGGGKRSRSVTVVMQAVNLDANEKVWMKVETVRKLVGRPGAPPQA